MKSVKRFGCSCAYAYMYATVCIYAYAYVALYICGKFEKEKGNLSTNICLQMAIYLQMQSIYEYLSTNAIHLRISIYKWQSIYK